MINYDAMIAQAQDPCTQINDLQALAVGALAALKEIDEVAKELVEDEFYNLPSFIAKIADDYTLDNLEKYVEEVDQPAA